MLTVIPNWYDRDSHTQEIITAALTAADPQHSVQRFLKRDGDVLRVGEMSYLLPDFRRVVILGFGKASTAMAEAAQTVLGDWLSGGLVVTKYGHSRSLERIEVVEAGHPLPDEEAVRGAMGLLRYVGTTTPDDLIIALVSGGGSALLTLPVDGVSLVDLQVVNAELLRSGASIHQINTIRKHLSRVKGGNLARWLFPAKIISLVLSDVVGNDIDVIASGPFSPDPTTFDAAWEILVAYGLENKFPSSVLEYLQRGIRMEIPETPKQGDPSFHDVQTLIIGDNRSAALAAVERVRALGFETRLLTTSLQGEARNVGREIVEEHLVRASTANDRAGPVALILGGETTVTVLGDGKGGRNQELTLSAAIAMNEIGLMRTRLISFATDGGDGPTEAAGAVADSASVARAERLGLDAGDHLSRSDSFSFFSALDDLVVTGPTGTNVNDITVGLLY